MADPVLEARIQQFKDLEAEAHHGDNGAAQTLFFALSEITSQQTKWQWIIHGDTVTYRKRCVRWLVQEKRYTQARRFALCGRGDVGFLADDEKGVKIQPRGCGARFCPRCSKRYGRKFLARVGKHLARGPHGELWHIVLTQRVWVDESLQEARDRFGRAWKKFYPTLRKAGMRSALATYHVTPSGVKGWHFHCHVLVELNKGIHGDEIYQTLDDGWFEAMQEGVSQRKELFMRHVSDAGDVLAGMEKEQQLEFWSESRDPVEKVLQYVLRDILQGVEGWIEKLQTDDQARDFAKALSSAKLHRLYGEWRKSFKDELDVEEGDVILGMDADKDKKKPTASVTVWHALGGMDEVFWCARQGQAAAILLVRALLGRSNNKGVVGIRLSRLVKELAL